MTLDLEGLVHCVLLLLLVMTIAAKSRTTALDRRRVVELDDSEHIDWTGALTAASAWAHPHIPRWRNKISPCRASGGSASPSAAALRVSYWAVMRDVSGEATGTVPELTSEIFFRVLARSSGRAARRRALGAPTSTVRAPELAGLAVRASREEPAPRPEACADRVAPASWGAARRSRPRRSSPWPGRTSVVKPRIARRRSLRGRLRPRPGA